MTNPHAADDMDVDNPSFAGVNNLGGPLLQNLPSNRKTKEYLAPTAFAPTYRSIFTLTPPGDKLLPILTHLNCSYLSTPGIAPTLLQLKQHAQSLVILIKNLTVSTTTGVIDYQNLSAATEPPFHDGETYDFLNNLSTPYTGPSNPGMLRHHEMPLHSLLNTVQQESAPNPTAGGPAYAKINDVCPLHRAEKPAVMGQAMPYATHQALIQHANEVLEILDHEYSARGGLLAILPNKEEKEQRGLAETTILGQLILYMNKLVQRLHDLERSYANALDVIADESVVPSQMLSRLGPEGRKGREMVYPQDRFVLVNAGDDLWTFLDREFQKKERADEIAEENYKRMGTTGEAIWEKRGGKEMARGITAVDIQTRYYRLRNDPLKTVFVIPAHQEHPGTKVTRQMESQPTVVSVVKPVWPERVSMWEMRQRADLEELKRVRRENAEMTRKAEWLEQEKVLLLHENKTKDSELRLTKKKLEVTRGILEGDIDTERAKIWGQINATNTLRQETLDLGRKLKREQAAIAAEKEATSKGLADLDSQHKALRREREDMSRLNKQKYDDMVQKAAELDKENADTAVELQTKLKGVWTEQIAKTQVLIEFLNRKAVLVGGDEIPEDIKKIGEECGKLLAMSTIGGQRLGEAPASGPLLKKGKGRK